MTRATKFVPMLALCALFACTSTPSPTPTPTPDAGSPTSDAGEVVDAGSPTPDGGDDVDAGHSCGEAVTSCTSSVDCPASTDACLINSCENGCCSSTAAAPGTPCDSNGGTMCDGAGLCVPCLSTADCTPSGTSCKAASCVDNTCQYDIAPLGTTCADSGGVVCNGGACVAMHCADGVKDADETDKDCGGSTCSACAPGAACLKPSDCASLVCGANEICEAPSCSDGVMNGNETDEDCGGAECDAMGTTCGLNLGCLVGADCASGYCEDRVCARKSAGSSCSSNDQCDSNQCGTTGGGSHCCASACPAAVAACGAVDCDSNGACVYPGNSVAPASLQTSGDCQSVVCNGNGGAMTMDSTADLPFPNTCQESPACCGPSPLTPCFTSLPTGTTCTNAFNPNAHVCGDTSNSYISGQCVECVNDSDCLAINSSGTLTCNTYFGLCE